MEASSRSDLAWRAADLSHFGEMSLDDAARRLCTLYIEDLADLITSTVDIGFGLSRYGHHLTTGPGSMGAHR